jgi:diacylglycerol kinase family enzyme
VNRSSASVSARRRLAALVALVGVVALVAFVIDVLFGNLANVVIGLVGLAIAVAGAWWVIAEDMPRRAIGGVAIAVGVVIVGAGLVRSLNGADRIGIRIALFILLFGVTIACARAAMLRELHRLDLRVRAGGPPTHPVLLCNPWSGGGKVERFGLRELAADLGVETVMLAEGLDLEQLARDAVARGADCLGMAGGDGSQALVASIAVEHGLPFVCVSAGTRNHFALDLGLNREDPRESMYAFRDAYERVVDFATVNERFFVNNASLGVYAKIVQEDDYREAKVETTKTLLPEMLGRQAAPFDLQFTAPDGAEVDGAILVMVSNNAYVIGASVDSAQRRHLDRGQLGVFAVTTRTGAEAARLFAAQALGRRTRNPSWHEFGASEFEIRSRSGSTFVGVDGEALELATPLRFRIHPRGLTLLVPAGNIEAAERRRARDVHVGDLLAIAAGHEPNRST